MKRITRVEHSKAQEPVRAHQAQFVRTTPRLPAGRGGINSRPLPNQRGRSGPRIGDPFPLQQSNPFGGRRLTAAGNEPQTLSSAEADSSGGAQYDLGKVPETRGNALEIIPGARLLDPFDFPRWAIESGGKPIQEGQKLVVYHTPIGKGVTHQNTRVWTDEIYRGLNLDRAHLIGGQLFIASAHWASDPKVLNIVPEWRAVSPGPSLGEEGEIYVYVQNAEGASQLRADEFLRRLQNGEIPRSTSTARIGKLKPGGTFEFDPIPAKKDQTPKKVADKLWAMGIRPAGNRRRNDPKIAQPRGKASILYGQSSSASN